MVSRLKQKKLADCELVDCETCAGKSLNPDYHPGSVRLTRCCLDCNGLGKVDKETGPLAVEQIVEYWRAHYWRVARENLQFKNDFQQIGAAFRVIERHAPEVKRRDPNAPTDGFYESTSKRAFGAVSSD